MNFRTLIAVCALSGPLLTHAQPTQIADINPGAGSGYPAGRVSKVSLATPDIK